MRLWLWTDIKAKGQVLFLCWMWTEPFARTSPKAPAHPRGPETAAARTGVRLQEAGVGRAAGWLEATMGEKQLGKESGGPGSETLRSPGWPGHVRWGIVGVMGPAFCGE